MDFTKDFFNLILDFGDEWVITDIEVDHRKSQVYLELEYKSEYYEDPDTLDPAKLYDHTEIREWRHLDILHHYCPLKTKYRSLKSLTIYNLRAF